MARRCAGLPAALDRVPDAPDRTAGLCNRHRAPGKTGTRPGLWSRGPGAWLTAHAAPPVPSGITLEIAKNGRDGTGRGQITLAGGYANHGEPVRLLRDTQGRATELWLGGAKLLPEAALARELLRRYDGQTTPTLKRRNT